MPLDLLLIHPPVVRPSEPPLGAAALAGFLRRQGLNVEILDLNVEVLTDLLSPGDFSTPQDHFSKRAIKHLPSALHGLRSPDTLRCPARYRSFISHLDRILRLRMSGNERPRISLADFRHPLLSPIRSQDIRKVAMNPEKAGMPSCLRDRVLAAMGEMKPRWVGVSINYLSQVLPAAATIGFLRKAGSTIQIAAGGSMMKAWGKRFTTNGPLRGLVNQWVVGPGEASLAGLFDRKTTREFRTVCPSFEGIHWPAYLSPERILPLAASRGCYWRKCVFCQEAVSGVEYHSGKLHRILTVAEREMALHDVKWIHFTDNALSPNALNGLAKTRTGALWFGFARFEEIFQNRRLVRDLYRSGCRMLQIGLESGSQQLLDAMGKGIRLKEVSRSLRTLHDEGIGTLIYVMYGAPGEKRSDARDTLKFVLDHAPWIDYLSCSILNLPKEAPVPEGTKTFPFSEEGEDLGLYTNFASADGMNRREARRFVEHEFLRHPVISEIMARMPPVFTSNHAPLFFNTIGRRPMSSADVS